MTALAQEIHSLSEPLDERAVAAEVRAYLDATYPDLASLAGPSRKKRRTLDEDIEYWTKKEEDARQKLTETQDALPGAIAAATDALTSILDRAQKLSLERYALSDAVAGLLAELDSSAPRPDEEEGTPRERTRTLLEQVEDTHKALARAQAALAWSSVLQRILKMRDTTLDPANHSPSPLAALPHFRDLHQSVSELENTLPAGMALLDSVRAVQAETWVKLKDALGASLTKASEALKWPLRVDYPSCSASERRTFERAYTEMLYFQTEGEKLGMVTAIPDWTSGEGLYPLQTLVKPIALRFKYHFMGKRNTNRVDKPEWGFANIQDAIYEHANFISDYLQPLTAHAGYASVDVKSEFTLLLFPILLQFLRTRIPHLLSHPALLAHTVYQSVLFDDAVRENGFDLGRTSPYLGVEEPEWEGLAGVILREEDWFEQWLNGEKKFAENSLNDIISSPNAWHISDGRDEVDDSDVASIPTTESARQVRALLEQITDRYSPLPALEYRVAFLRNVQIPLLTAYHARVAGSLDAFETLSSAFVRVIPGALGQRQTSDSRLAGAAGLEKLIKAHVSANYMLAACRAWSNDILFVEMSADMASSDIAPSVWDPTMEKYASLRSRAEDMMVRLISSEVEHDLKQHLTRRWDVATSEAPWSSDTPDIDIPEHREAALVGALTTFSTLVSAFTADLPPAATARVYRRVATHLANHITQRAVFAGWSKFTAKGGKALQGEIDDWRSAASTALSAAPSVAVDAPWTKLAAMANVLALPTENQTGVSTLDQPTFAQAMAAAWGAPSALESLKERAGIKELSGDELQTVLRRRVECWR